jgi:serine/threonine-protein kinase RsbW
MTMTKPISPPPADSMHRPVRRASFMFEATLDDVSLVAQALRIFLPAEVSEDARNEIEIGVVEAMTNIVRHGYGDSQAGIIEVSYDFSDGTIVIELTDHGIPMATDALFRSGDSAFDFDPADIAHLPESGMGIALMKATFDHIGYSRNGDANTLRLEKSANSE